MLVFTNLLEEVSKCLKLVSICNFPPLAYPYEIRIEEDFYKISVHRSFLSTSWKIHFPVALSAIIFLFTHILIDPVSLFEICALVALVLLYILIFLSIPFQFLKSQDFAALLSQFSSFEERYAFGGTGIQRLAASKKKSVIKLACRFYSFVFFMNGFSFAIACVIFPNLPWNYLPAAFLKDCKDFTDCAIKTPLVFIYAFVATRVYMNYASINVIINLLIPTYCFCSSLELLKRYSLFA